MARTLARRLRVEGDLVAEGPLHAGSGAWEPGLDLALARDGQGRLYLPGTGLAGALRAWCVRAFGSEAVREVWGHQSPPVRFGAATGSASLVLVEDAPVRSGGVAVRDGVGIDRRYGAGAEDHLYQRAVLLPGARIDLAVDLESPPESGPAAEAMIAHLVAALEQGRVRVGASRSTGLGRVRLERTRVSVERFDGAPGLLAALERRLLAAPQEEARIELDAAGAALRPRPEPVVRVTVDWRAAGPLMARSGAEGIGVTVLPLVTPHGDELALLLPGSSIKGALRARAECIVRTLLAGLPDQDLFRRQIDLPLVDWLFGWSPEPVPGGAPEPPPPDPERPERGLAALRVDGCMSRRGIDPKRWDDLMAAESAVYGQRVLDTAAPGWEAATHVALDRWTGAPVPGALYTAVEPDAGGGEWGPIEMELDLGRLDGDPARPAQALALLLLTLDDMARGLVPLGWGASRGYGAVEVARVTVNGAGSMGLDEPETLAPAGPGRGLLRGSRARGALLPAWSAWLAQTKGRA